MGASNPHIPLLLGAALLLASASSVQADKPVPDVPCSTVSSGVILGSSSGQIPESRFVVTAKNNSCETLPGVEVRLIFAGTGALPYDTQTDGSTVDCPTWTISTLTDSQGEAVFYSRFGGSAAFPGLEVSVWVDGAIVTQVKARSTDITRDGQTSIEDLNLFRINFFNSQASLATDFNDDGLTELGDLNILRDDFFRLGMGTPCM
jgi:uncharacterized membrane-anchored protein